MQAGGDGLVLRDIHAATAPSWWPPAPGWWALAAVLLAVAIAVTAWRLARRHRRARMLAVFDGEVAAAPTPAAEIAAVSSLLRRAARRRHPDADALRDDAWLQLLAGDAARPAFSPASIALLRDGAWRRDADAAAVATLRHEARARYDGWTRP